MRAISIGQIVQSACAGVIGGLITFLLMRHGIGATEWAKDIFGTVHDYKSLLLGVLWLGLVTGIALGAALVLAEELPTRSPRRIVRRFFIAVAIGGICGALGGIVGQVFFRLLGLLAILMGMVGMMIAHTVEWALIGAAAGICPGAVNRSSSRIVKGSIGGAAGGAAGGLLFDMIALVTNGSDTSRCVGFIIIGVAVGVAVSTVDELTKRYWLVAFSGKKEGRSYILSNETTNIGSDDHSDILLIGDPEVQSVHARVVNVDQTVYIQASVGVPLTVNRFQVNSSYLIDGDVIGIGRHRLLFRSQTEFLPGDAPDPWNLRSETNYYLGAETANDVPPQTTSIHVVNGPHTDMTFTLVSGIVIGREPQCGIALVEDTRVSRRHAQLTYEGSDWRLDDLGSTNGTYVNGQRIISKVTHVGDAIQVGDSVLQIE